MMLKGGYAGLASVAMLAVAGCGGSNAELNIRSVSSGIAAGERPVPERIAEARGHFRLGNMALALEAFRRALRDDRASVDALNGLAACYDKMGRFDLSRSHYEQALALAPGDARLYRNLALSLDLQGRRGEAESVRMEMKQRLAAGHAATLELAEAEAEAAETAVAERPVPVVGSGAPAASVTVALAPAQPQPATKARLQRLSLGEVALVTTGKPVWTARNTQRRDEPAAARLTLLNAARVAGLAARTRTTLEGRGWKQIAIGNASQVEAQSVIAYPAARRADAVRLQRQFGFALRQRPSADGPVVVMLGRDAAKALRVPATS
ncbi:LytR C-terminal domain-containing protein [Sphingomonas sp. GCM10030256]|uniref:LytR C-terminal domain-containing protein n=1 Tax=Sphingomonas sp. GCM10030256 TaxID=3273427 RepID=UPI0036095023